MEKKQDAISRNKFLKSLGFKGASLLALYCVGKNLSSCTPANGVSPTSNIDFTIDLNSATSLASIGGYIIQNNVVIAKTGTNSYVAASSICPHENRNAMVFSNGSYYCQEHGAVFTNVGTPSNNITNRSLKVYNTSLSGTNLRVYS